MKNRRNIIVAFMLCAVMFLGLGYAALTDVLDITGTAELTAGNALNAFDADVYFSGAEVVDAKAGAAKADAVEISTTDNDNAYFYSYNLAAKGDSVSFKFVIQNDSALQVSVAPSLSYVGTAEEQAVAQTWFNVTSNLNGATTDIAAGGSFEYIVTVTLKDTPTLTDEEKISSKFSITLNAVSADTVLTGNT